MSDVFKGLKEQLDILEWPSLYMFKFVCPNDNQTVANVIKHFNEVSEVEYKKSKNGKYIGVTVKELMLSAENIIEIYREVAKIKGVISL